MRYWRSTRYTVHREGCPTQPPGVVWWDWAEGMTRREIAHKSMAHGIRHRFCQKCLPA